MPGICNMRPACGYKSPARETGGRQGVAKFGAARRGRDESRLYRGGKSGAKPTFPVRKNENLFSMRLPHIGARKKLVARISKSEPLILKSKPLIFCPLKTRPADAGNQWSFGHKTVCYMPRKRGQKPTAVCRAGGALSQTGHQASSNCVLMPGRQLCARLKA